MLFFWCQVWEYSIIKIHRRVYNAVIFWPRRGRTHNCTWRWGKFSCMSLFTLTAIFHTSLTDVKDMKVICIWIDFIDQTTDQVSLSWFLFYSEPWWINLWDFPEALGSVHLSSWKYQWSMPVSLTMKCQQNNVGWFCNIPILLLIIPTKYCWGKFSVTVDFSKKSLEAWN